MKTYKTIQEYLNSKPAKEEVEKILTSINNKEISKARRNLFFMSLEFNRIQKYKKTTEKMGFKVSEDTIQREKALWQEIEILKKELPPSKPRIIKEKPKPVKDMTDEELLANIEASQKSEL